MSTVKIQFISNNFKSPSKNLHNHSWLYRIYMVYMVIYHMKLNIKILIQKQNRIWYMYIYIHIKYKSTVFNSIPILPLCVKKWWHLQAIERFRQTGDQLKEAQDDPWWWKPTEGADTAVLGSEIPPVDMVNIPETNILLMEEIRPTSWQLRLVVYPIIYRVLYIPGGAGFLPSTVAPEHATLDSRRFRTWKPPCLGTSC